MRFTKGPWVYKNRYKSNVGIYTEYNDPLAWDPDFAEPICVANLYRSMSGDDTAADALLMAAAPELLKAIESVLQASEDNGDMGDIDWGTLRRVVAKAKGETPRVIHQDLG